MKLKVKTQLLKEMTSKAAAGSSNTGGLLLTSSMCIECDNNTLKLTTTDGANTLHISNAVESQEKFYVCTDSTLFSKLVSKTDSEYITLEVIDTYLQFTGSGVYNLPLIMDEEGNMAVIEEMNLTCEPVKVEAALLKKAISTNKVAVSKDFAEPIYTGYCISNNAVMTNKGNLICHSDLSVNNLKALIPMSFIELCNLFDDKYVDIKVEGVKLSFQSEHVKLTGSLLDGIDRFPVDSLKALIDMPEFKYNVKINKSTLLNCLDRMLLFVSESDSFAVSLTFQDSKVLISNKDSTACESIDYKDKVEGLNFQAYFVTVDLKTMLSANSEEIVTLVLGPDNCMKMVDKNTTLIIPFLQDTEE